MADIELVIRIDEDYVKIINKNGASNYPEEVIKNGIPLPKGHGRLIAAERYRKEMLDSREFNFFATLDLQQTLIEADKYRK